MATIDKKYGADVPTHHDVNDDDAELLALGYVVCRLWSSVYTVHGDYLLQPSFKREFTNIATISFVSIPLFSSPQSLI